jgi:hypothetical protein
VMVKVAGCWAEDRPPDRARRRGRRQRHAVVIDRMTDAIQAMSATRRSA